MPLGGAVASMISSVVNQSANMAATTAVGKAPQVRSTFGKRNIKNQVRYEKYYIYFELRVPFCINQ